MKHCCGYPCFSIRKKNGWGKENYCALLNSGGSCFCSLWAWKLNFGFCFFGPKDYFYKNFSLVMIHNSCSPTDFVVQLIHGCFGSPLK